MAKFFIADSVVDEVHEREIPDHIVAGLPLAQAVAVIHAWDSYNIDGDDSLENVDHRTYTEGNYTGRLEVNQGRGHFYGIVYNPADPTEAKRWAEEMLKEWNPLDDEDNE